MTFWSLLPVIGMPDAPDPVNSIVLRCALGHTVAMKPFMPLSGFFLALAACAPLSIYYRPGVSVSRMQTDQTNCQVSALAKAPVANQMRQRPPVYFPGQQYCTASGCYSGPGYWVNGGYYTVDVNSDLRNRVEAQCMGAKGYQPVSLPLCSPGIKSSVAPAQTQTLPPLSEQSCSIRYDDGSWQIVTPISANPGG